MATWRCVFLRMADAARPGWILWENSARRPFKLDGGTWTHFHREGMVQTPGSGGPSEWLTLSLFESPPRRRQVFVVGHPGDWRHAAAVLAEPATACRGIPRRAAKRERIANALTERPDRGGGNSEGQRLVAPTISARTRGGGLGTDFDCDGGLIAGTLQANYADKGSTHQHRWTRVARTLATPPRRRRLDAKRGRTERTPPSIAATLAPAWPTSHWQPRQAQRNRSRHPDRLRHHPSNQQGEPIRAKARRPMPPARGGSSCAGGCIRFADEYAALADGQERHTASEGSQDGRLRSVGPPPHAARVRAFARLPRRLHPDAAIAASRQRTGHGTRRSGTAWPCQWCAGLASASPERMRMTDSDKSLAEILRSQPILKPAGSNSPADACPDCGGSGWIFGEDRARRCDCLKRKIREDRQKRFDAEIPPGSGPVRGKAGGGFFARRCR